MELLTPALGLFVWNLLAFIIVLLILKKFAWKPILNSLKERETGIADSIASADKIKAEMANLKSENEALLNTAREERAVMLRLAKEASDKMIQEAKDKARTEYDRIVADAQSMITQQKNAALTDVKNTIGKMVIEITEKVIRKELVHKEEHEQYIKKLADDLSATRN